MAGWKEILINVLKLTNEVKHFNNQTEKLGDRTVEIDKRVVRLETMIEIAQKQSPKNRLE
jgi:hypothetical protein